MAEIIYLDTYVLQQDMRVRLPKAILTNMDVEKGKTQFDIYLDAASYASFSLTAASSFMLIIRLLSLE